MGDTPVFSSPALPRIAPPTLHTRTPSRSPTRQRFADDILSDLTPSTTLAAFKNPSGRLRASIEDATPSKQAFGLRAALASKSIQEWVDELSNWQWPSEGGSLGFEVPPAKRRKLSSRTDGNTNQHEHNGTQDANEPVYVGSLLADEVLRYEMRLDEITADMEELNVEEIKRQVLDTHFSAKSRPSSSASNSPMPGFLSSYNKMDDFTAIVTATVLQALPNLSKLMRLMDVWSIRLSVLRKVPPLLQALEDAEIALKSGWSTINNLGSHNGEDVALSRDTFGVMREVLQDKVTTLGQDLDYMLDTLEGREDTLPESWLDRMEAIEQDYGEWVVSGDRKVRQGEWAKMAKARKEADEARKLKEAAAAKAAEEAETARRKGQQEADDAKAAEDAKRKAEQEAEEAEISRLQAIQNAENARLAGIERQRAQEEAEEARAAENAKQKAEQVEKEETARKQALQDAEDARNAEAARQAAQQAIHDRRVAENARLEAEKVAREAEMARKEALRDAEDAQSKELAAEKARNEAEIAETARLQAMRNAEDARRAEITNRNTQKAAEEADAAERIRQQAEIKAKELARQRAERDAEEATRLQSLKDAEEANQAREQAQQDARNAECARQQAEKDAEVTEATRIQSLKESEEAAARSRQAQKELEDAKAFEAATLKATEAARDQPFDQQAVKSVENFEIPAVQSTQQTDMGISTSTIVLPALAVGAGVALASTLLKKSSASAKISKIQPFDGNESEEAQPASSPRITIPVSQYDGVDTDMLKRFADEFVPEQSSLASPIRFEPSQQRSSSTPGTRKATISPITDPEDSGSPKSPRSPRFGHAFSKVVRRASSPKTFNSERPSSSDSTKKRKSFQLNGIFKSRGTASVPHSPTRSSVKQGLDMKDAKPNRSNDWDWTVVDSPEDMSAESFPLSTMDSTNAISKRNFETDGSRSKRHSRNISVVTGYSSTDPTPEIHHAEATEYFRPVMSPVSTGRSPVTMSEPLMPSNPPSDVSGAITIEETVPTLDGSETPTKLLNTTQTSDGERFHSASSSKAVTGGDECDVCEILPQEAQLEEFATPAVARKASITSIGDGVREILVSSSRHGSISSDTPTIMKASAGEVPSSPIASPSPALETFPEIDESPTAGRTGLRNGTQFDYSPPDSPPAHAISKRPALKMEQSALFSPTDATGPLTPLEPPVFDDINVSPAPLSSPKKASSDEQLQKQISTLLESIPARIRLTSELETSPFSSNTLQPKKARRSITPSFRSSSSMSNYSTSSRAPTPSFTLAPAFSKTNHRSRTPGNPEIKLYHLSRSTGEAPIKLFVRLVGEHGERVMVRVGGGWADLGEYLKEYASHHGRRTAADNDRVEIQDLPPRVVSNSSSIATIRGNGRDSPVPRPQSVLERPMDRPGSSLNIRKTRKSVGESETRANDIRSPSTPLPNINRRSYETPPSAAGSEASSTSTGPSFRSSSRLSWTDEDSSLGLAGPKSKKVVISEKDQEWVENMKEKVRQASAEKEKRNREKESTKESQRKSSFGEMDRVGGTKRLFRKTGV